jgi:hypothetical protein
MMFRARTELGKYWSAEAINIALLTELKKADSWRQ